YPARTRMAMRGAGPPIGRDFLREFLDALEQQRRQHIESPGARLLEPLESARAREPHAQLFLHRQRMHRDLRGFALAVAGSVRFAPPHPAHRFNAIERDLRSEEHTSELQSRL